MIIETHECPGGCSRHLTEAELACRICFGLLPRELREAYTTAGLYSDHDGQKQAEALALGWFAELHRRNAAIPRGTRKVENGTTYEWGGITWKVVTRAELDTEAWRKSRERPV